MRFIAALGLIFALVFSLAIFGEVVDLGVDMSALTTGPVQTLTGLVPQFWLLLVGLGGLALLVLAVGTVFLR
jgi:hypothetical protein